MKEHPLWNRPAIFCVVLLSVPSFVSAGDAAPRLAGKTTAAVVEVDNDGDGWTAVDAVRQLSALTPAGFADTSVGVIVQAAHVTEIRTALDAALSQLGFPSGGYTDSSLTGVAIKAMHIQELRNRVK